MNFGEIVFLITDPEQKERMVTGKIERPSGILYELSCGTEISAHFKFEISMEKDVVKAVKGLN